MIWPNKRGASLEDYTDGQLLSGSQLIKYLAYNRNEMEVSRLFQ